MTSDYEDDTTDVDEFLDHYQYMECRGDGHDYPRMKPWQGWEIQGNGPQQVFVRHRRCKICKVVRVERRNNRGRSLSGRYEGYPEGYKAEGLRVTRTDVYRIGLQKMLENQAAATRKPVRRSSARLRRKGTS